MGTEKLGDVLVQRELTCQIRKMQLVRVTVTVQVNVCISPKENGEGGREDRKYS